MDYIHMMAHDPANRSIRNAQAIENASGAEGPAAELHPRQLRGDAILAMQEGRFHDAVELWRICDQRTGLRGRDRLKFAKALEHCGLIPAAFDAYRAYPLRAGIDHLGLLNEASLHAQLEHLPAALDVLDMAVQAAVGSALEDEARRVRAGIAIRAGRLLDAMTDYVRLSQMKPEDPTGLIGQIDIHLRDRDAASAEAVLEMARQRHADDLRLLYLQARLLNQRGSDVDMLAFAEHLAGQGPSEEMLRTALSNLVGGRIFHFTDAFRTRMIGIFDGLPHAKVALGILNKKVPPTPALLLEQARKEAEERQGWPDSPPGIRARARLAAQLIANNELAEASLIIDGLRRSVEGWPYPPPVIGAVVEWQLARRGSIQEAQHSYWRRRRMIATRDRTGELVCLRHLPGIPPPVTVFCQLRNELAVLPAFFRHYRAIGVDRFVMIDNASDDGSLEWLLEQPDVELHRTRSPFRRAEAGNAWINPLIAGPDYANTLCLRVDADEHLVYPHAEARPIAMLWQHMQAEMAEVLAGCMIDMLPERLADLEAPMSDFTQVARFFDPAPDPFPAVLCPYLQYMGGPRTRLLGGKPQHLTKSSGLRGGGRIEQIGASHQTSPARVSSVGMVLLHYKFRPDFFDRARRIAAEHQYSAASQEYTRYEELAAIKDMSLLTETSREYTGSASLIESGMLRSTARWDR